ncbi:hypothetical protein [Limibacillus halophilus]
MAMRRSEKKLVFVSRSYHLALFFYAMCAIFAYALFDARDRLVSLQGWDGDAWFALAASCILLCFALLLSYKQRVLLNRETRELHWRKTSLFRTKRGSIPFEEVKGLHVHRSGGENRTFNLSLEMPDRTLHLMDDSGWDGLDRIVVAQRALEEMLGLPSKPLEEDLRWLLENGHGWFAVRLLRKEKGLTKSGAKEFLDSLPRRTVQTSESSEPGVGGINRHKETAVQSRR